MLETTTPEVPAIDPARIYIAESGATFILPEANAYLITRGNAPETVSESTLRACFPRVTHGTATDGFAWNPVTQFCEVRRDGVVVFLAETVAAATRAGYVFLSVEIPPLVAAIAAQVEHPADSYEQPIQETDAPEGAPDDDHHAVAIVPPIQTAATCPQPNWPARPCHSHEPEVKEAAKRCHAARKEHLLPNDDVAMRAALMAVTGKDTQSRKEWTVEDYDALTKEINNGAFRATGRSSWQRVLFQSKKELEMAA